MLRRLLVALLVGGSSVMPVAPVYASDFEVFAPDVLITEVKLGGGNEHKEFVEIYNNAQEPVDLAGWVLEYAKSSYNPDNCSVESWESSASTASQVNEKFLSGVLEPSSFLEIEIPLNDAVSGSARIISGTGETFTVHDLVGWGETSPCYEGLGTAPIPANNKSITRLFSPEGSPIDSDENAIDFSIEDTPTPGTDKCLELDCYEEPEAPVVDSNVPCAVLLSEILANPSGTDAGREYVELFNPTPTTQSLSGCKLKTSGLSAGYSFPAQSSMNPGEYRIFTAGQLSPTGMQIVNSGGEIWLLDDNHEDIVVYPPASDDESWALIDNQWQSTDVPTPNAVNQKATIKTTGSTADSELAPCPAGKFRNPQTNRCKNIDDDEGLTPCKAGQQRNPDTNRCRNVAGATSRLASCQAGYERNPQTNRCRKVSTGVANPASLSENTDASAVTSLNYLVLGLVSAMAIGYGVYEYRHDFVNAYARVKNRIFKSRLLK